MARAGIWRLGSQSLDSISLYRRDLARHEQLPSIDARNFPHYLEALHSGRAIDAHDAQHDLRTRELTPGYLLPLGITSMLDASIRIEGEVVGILCLEHVGPKRIWQADEIAFAGELADQFAQVLINQEKRSVTHEMCIRDRFSSSRVTSAPRTNAPSRRSSPCATIGAVGMPHLAKSLRFCHSALTRGLPR